MLYGFIIFIRSIRIFPFFFDELRKILFLFYLIFHLFLYIQFFRFFYVNHRYFYVGEACNLVFISFYYSLIMLYFHIFIIICSIMCDYYYSMHDLHMFLWWYFVQFLGKIFILLGPGKILIHFLILLLTKVIYGSDF